MITTKMVDASELVAYEDSLAAIEKEHKYPLDGDGSFFRISHGKTYSAFFSSMGKPYFVLAFSKHRLVGCMAIVSKEVFINKKPKKALYFCDLKISKSHCGEGISTKMYKAGFWGLMKRGLLTPKPMVYFIAMQGDKGDFQQSSHSSFIRHWFKCFANLNIYFSNSKNLAKVCTAEAVSTEQLWLSNPKTIKNTNSSQSLKTLINTQTNQSIKLSHIAVQPNFINNTTHYLALCAHNSSKTEELCFAIDSREKPIVDELRGAGVKINGTAKVYCMIWDMKNVKNLNVWLGTNEI